MLEGERCTLSRLFLEIKNIPKSLKHAYFRDNICHKILAEAVRSKGSDLLIVWGNARTIANISIYNMCQ